MVQIVIINYSSNITSLLISLIKIDGCYNFLFYQFHYSFYHTHYSFYQTLFYLHPAFHAGVSQPVCKPSEITEFCVILMIQKISNRGKHWKLVNARNKMNQHRSNSKGVQKKKKKKKKKKKTLCKCSSPLVIIS